MSKTIMCDVNKLPEEIKQKAQEYAKHKRPQFRTFSISSYDIENAWLQGFAFCVESKVKVETTFYEKACEGADQMHKDLKKAKEIIVTFLGLIQTFGYSPSMEKFITEAGQFVNSEDKDEAKQL